MHNNTNQPTNSLGDKEVLIDTCWIVQACSTVGDPTPPNDGYKQIDQEVRSLNISPKQMRREIEALIVNNKLLVPEIMIRELKDFLLDSCKKLSNKSKNRLSNLIEKIKGKIVKVSIGVNEYKLQESIFTLIESEAKKRVASIELRTNSKLPNWEHTIQHNTTPAFKEIYKDPVCKTWQKIRRFKASVINTSRGIKNHEPFLLNDFLILLTAKKRKALIKTNDGDIKVLLAAYNQILKETEVKNTHQNYECSINK